MTNPTEVPTIAEEDEDLSYAQAAMDVSAAQRKEYAAQVAELRRRMDRAKENARKAQDRFERTVYLLASGQPRRIDWYEHAGALPRKDLIKAAGLTTQGLHRVMQKQNNQINRQVKAKGKKR